MKTRKQASAFGIFLLIIVLFTSCKEETVKEPPVADFTADTTSIKREGKVQFTDLSTHSPTNWLWNFGDGKTSTAQNPLHTYLNLGIYTVMLTISDSDGNYSEIRKADYIAVTDTAVIETGTVTDYEGNVYTTIIIGNQEWMTENLRATKYNDGTEIPYVNDIITWNNLSSPAYCWYENNEMYKATYGALYNWYAVDTGKLAPEGWHVSTDSDWFRLANYLGGAEIAGGKLKEAGTKHWEYPNKCATNETGFSAIPGGIRAHNGYFIEMGRLGEWWVKTDFTGTNGYLYMIDYLYCGVIRTFDVRQSGKSVRCVKNN